MDKFARLGALTFIGTLALGMAASPGGAQTPSYARPGGATASPSGAQTPSYARPGYASDEDAIHGRILSFHGAYDVDVRDDRGFVDHIALRQGTIINPIGLRLTPGMSVTILGYNRGSTFQANEIDTPYMAENTMPLYGSGYGPYYPYAPYYSPSVIIAPSFGWGRYYRHWR
jgi:hypothetical protein